MSITVSLSSSLHLQIASSVWLTIEKELALRGAHTFAKPQRSSLIQSLLIQYQTWYSCINLNLKPPITAKPQLNLIRPTFCFKLYQLNNTLSGNVKGGEKRFMELSLYSDPDQKLMGSILGRDPSTIQVSWKSIWWVLLNPACKQTNGWNKQEAASIKNAYIIQRLKPLKTIILKNATGPFSLCPFWATVDTLLWDMMDSMEEDLLCLQI